MTHTLKLIVPGPDSNAPGTRVVLDGEPLVDCVSSVHVAVKVGEDNKVVIELDRCEIEVEVEANEVVVCPSRFHGEEWEPFGLASDGKLRVLPCDAGIERDRAERTDAEWGGYDESRCPITGKWCGADGTGFLEYGECRKRGSELAYRILKRLTLMGKRRVYGELNPQDLAELEHDEEVLSKFLPEVLTTDEKTSRRMHDKIMACRRENAEAASKSSDLSTTIRR